MLNGDTIFNFAVIPAESGIIRPCRDRKNRFWSRFACQNDRNKRRHSRFRRPWA